VGRFRFGQIIEAYIQDGTGRTKERPALIISKDEENDQGLDLLVIAITRNIEDPKPDIHVVVHRDWKRDPVTGLTAPCVVKCNWVRDVKQDNVIRSLGRMPEDLLKVIVETFDRIQADPEFDRWI
jgi:mRNA-degrading endonuclease toxin of MazEF toxin-antitoxin module